MQGRMIDQGLSAALSAEPTIGTVLDLCEENYRLLCRLAPGLSELRGNYSSRLPGHMDLHLEVQEHTPYTSLIHLTYYFRNGAQHDSDPDALFRVYHDAKQVEVLDLKQHALPLLGGYRAPGLRNKWRVNLFVSKWLTYCICQGHKFLSEPVSRRRDMIALEAGG